MRLGRGWCYQAGAGDGGFQYAVDGDEEDR